MAYGASYFHNLFCDLGSGGVDLLEAYVLSIPGGADCVVAHDVIYIHSPFCALGCGGVDAKSETVISGGALFL